MSNTARGPLGWWTTRSAILFDYLKLRLWDGGRLGRTAPGPSRGDFQLVSLSGMIYSIKLEAMLGKALQLQGYRPVVLCRRAGFWPRRYFQAFGIRDFIYLEDFPVSDADREQARAAAAGFIASGVSFPQVKVWQYEGAPVGQYALSSVARAMHKGMPDLSDPEVLERLERDLETAILNLLRARQIVAKRSGIKGWLFNEINYTEYGPLFYATYERGENVIQFVHALRDRALILKRISRTTYRMHPNSVSRSTLDVLRSKPWSNMHDAMIEREFDDRYSGKWSLSRRDQEGARLKGVDEVRRQLALDPAKRTVVVFSHILWDANLFYGDDLFDDNEHWFVETLKAACRNDRVNWVIKLHPAIKWKMALDGSQGELAEAAIIREKVGPLPSHVKLLYPDTDINTFSIIQVTEVGVTIRGTIGMELAALGIPVVTAGTGRYSGLGFTIDPPSRAAYLERLASIQDLPPLDAEQTASAKRYALAVFCLRPWVMTSFENVHDNTIRGAHPLNPRLELRAASAEELARADDLRKFAQWAVGSDAVDYLEDWPVAAKP